MENSVGVRLHLPSAPGSGAALRRRLLASSRRYHRPTGQIQPPGRTQDWIKLGGKVTFTLRLYSVLKERIGVARIGAKHSLLLGILLGGTIYALTCACTKSIVMVAGLKL